MKDDRLISLNAAIDAFLTELTKRERTSLLHTWSTVEVKYFIAKILEQMPSAQRYTDEEVQKIQDLEQLEIEKAFQLGREDAQRWIPCSECEKRCDKWEHSKT